MNKTIRSTMIWFSISIIMLGLGSMIAQFKYISLETRVKKLESPPAQVNKNCLDYTLRQYRSGDTPEKCSAEIYGDTK